MLYRLPLFFFLVASLAACGSLAEPRPTFEPTNTALPREGNPVVDQQVAIEATIEQPTATPSPTETGDAHADHTVMSASATPSEAADAHADHTDISASATPEDHNETSGDQHDHTDVSASPTPHDHAEAEHSDAVVVNGIEGDPASGEFWFNGGLKVTYNNVEWQCSTCHTVKETLPGTGPYLYGIANHAPEHGAPLGLDAAGYLADSILNPSHVLAPDQVAPDGTVYVWKDGVMPNNWNTVIDETMLADLVSYLMQQNQAGETHDH